MVYDSGYDAKFELGWMLFVINLQRQFYTFRKLNYFLVPIVGEVTNYV